MLRPEDPFAQPIMSRVVNTDSLALKISVPKRTGRKRKRGSNDPYIEDTSAILNQPPTAEDAFKRLQDNPNNYTIEAVGLVNETHRFRTMPDFVSVTNGIPLVEKVKSTILTFDFHKMKNFEIAPTKGAPPDIYIPPPKLFSIHPQPFNYVYRQNPAVRLKHDSTTGKPILRNTQKPDRLVLQPFPANASDLPTAAPDALAPISSLSETAQAGIIKLRAFMEHRPIITRRVGLNHLGRTYEHSFKSMSQYCGFQFRSGPWRDTLVRYGVDPRSSREYRGYQTLMFQTLVPAVLGGAAQNGWRAGEGGGAGAVDASGEKWKWNRGPKYRPKEGEEESHVFDGNRLWTDGKTWQICDIQDPLLREMMEKSPLREECDLESDGWFANGTMAKLRMIMKDMIHVLLVNAMQNQPAMDEVERGPSGEDRAVWREIATLMPDIIEEKVLDTTYISVRRKNPHLEELATQVRNQCKRGFGGKYIEGAHEMGIFDRQKNAARLEAINRAADKDSENESSDEDGATDGDVDTNAVAEMEEEDEEAEHNASTDPLDGWR